MLQCKRKHETRWLWRVTRSCKQWRRPHVCVMIIFICTVYKKPRSAHGWFTMRRVSLHKDRPTSGSHCDWFQAHSFGSFSYVVFSICSALLRFHAIAPQPLYLFHNKGTSITQRVSSHNRKPMYRMSFFHSCIFSSWHKVFLFFLSNRIGFQ